MQQNVFLQFHFIACVFTVISLPCVISLGVYLRLMLMLRERLHALNTTRDMRAMILLQWRNSASRFISFTLLLFLVYFFGSAVVRPMLREGENCRLWFWLQGIMPLSVSFVPLYLIFAEGMYWYYCAQLILCRSEPYTCSMNEKA